MCKRTLSARGCKNARARRSSGSDGMCSVADQMSFNKSAHPLCISVDSNRRATAARRGDADIIIASTGTSQYPAGVTFGAYYRPLPDTYAEIVP